MSEANLRDVFAALALLGIISERPIERNKSGTLSKLDKQGVADEAYEIADAMLVARGKK